MVFMRSSKKAPNLDGWHEVFRIFNLRMLKARIDAVHNC